MAQFTHLTSERFIQTFARQETTDGQSTTPVTYRQDFNNFDPINVSRTDQFYEYPGAAQSFGFGTSGQSSSFDPLSISVSLANHSVGYFFFFGGLWPGVDATSSFVSTFSVSQPTAFMLSGSNSFTRHEDYFPDHLTYYGDQEVVLSDLNGNVVFSRILPFTEPGLVPNALGAFSASGMIGPGTYRLRVYQQTRTQFIGGFSPSPTNETGALQVSLTIPAPTSFIAVGLVFLSAARRRRLGMR